MDFNLPTQYHIVHNIYQNIKYNNTLLTYL